MYILRQLRKDDYKHQYLQLLSQLSYFKLDTVTQDSFNQFVDNLHLNHQIYILDDPKNNIVVGSITLLFEPKVIHELGMVCHLEDIVIHPEYRNQKLSRQLIEKAIQLAKARGCYKIILNCSESMKPFYQKFGFSSKNLEMSLYNDN